ncbi:MAG: hypothetical protein ACYDB2_10820 [Acidimicrobiales bacterium]
MGGHVCSHTPLHLIFEPFSSLSTYSVLEDLLTNALGNPATLADFNTGAAAPEALAIGASNITLEAAATP